MRSSKGNGEKSHDESPSKCTGKSLVVDDIRHRLSVHVQSRMSSGAEDEVETVKQEESSGSRPCSPWSPLAATNVPVECSPAEKTVETLVGDRTAPSGSFMAGSLVLSNSILGEVLNEKKLALLQSPEVIKFLRENQNKT